MDSELFLEKEVERVDINLFLKEISVFLRLSTGATVSYI